SDAGGGLAEPRHLLSVYRRCGDTAARRPVHGRAGAGGRSKRRAGRSHDHGYYAGRDYGDHDIARNYDRHRDGNHRAVILD
ncbi:MAG: hypothetical protein JSS00_02405, partial [Proteobacteria bacterium]|nr:hypothetical protein [Pseudomonadota bacterium]